IGEVEQTARVILSWQPFGIDQQDSGARCKSVPAVVFSMGGIGIGFCRRTGIGFQQSLPLQANRRENLVVPEDVAAGTLRLLGQLLEKAAGLGGLVIVVRSNRRPALTLELIEDTLSKFFVLGAVDDDAISIFSTAGGRGQHRYAQEPAHQRMNVHENSSDR